MARERNRWAWKAVDGAGKTVSSRTAPLDVVTDFAARWLGRQIDLGFDLTMDMDQTAGYADLKHPDGRVIHCTLTPCYSAPNTSVTGGLQHGQLRGDGSRAGSG